MTQSKPEMPSGDKPANMSGLKGATLRVLDYQQEDFLAEFHSACDQASLRENRDVFVHITPLPSKNADQTAESLIKVSFSEDARAFVSDAGMLYDVMDAYNQNEAVYRGAAHASNASTKLRKLTGDERVGTIMVAADDTDRFIADFKKGYARDGLKYGESYRIDVEQKPSTHPEVPDQAKLTITFTEQALRECGATVRLCMDSLNKIGGVSGRDGL